MDLELSLGFRRESEDTVLAARKRDLLRYINLKLQAQGLPTRPDAVGAELLRLASGLLANIRERQRHSLGDSCPADQRIEAFLRTHFPGAKPPLKLPSESLVLDRHGMARALSLPEQGDVFDGKLLTSYRIRNGVLHNPLKDRRTTVGTFHIAEGGLPIPDDKLAVPHHVFAEMFRHAVAPPPELMVLPFSVNDVNIPLTEESPGLARTWVSVLLRPIVQPDVGGYCPSKSMEVRFFAPGLLVSSVDFVESIFGNAGDPFLAANDAGLDIEHWTGHTGCIILAPHLTRLKKKEIGLPHINAATPRQRRDGMCWSDESELYNGGEAFKLTCRTADGVIITLISDSYYGYSKKEIKTQISYAANLMGGVEEEHAGGAVCFPSWNLGETFQFNSRRYNGQTLEGVVREYPEQIEYRPEGYGVDRNFPELYYISESARADLRKQRIFWTKDGVERSIPLLPGRVYMAPSGYKLRMEKHPGAPSWRLIGTAGEGTNIHKPCTVSGGGKSEISKSLVDYMQYGSVYVADFQKDMAVVTEIVERDYANRWRSADVRAARYRQTDSRPLLDPKRTLGSVIKLLTISEEEYTDEYNDWLRRIPEHIYALVFAIKRFHDPAWGADWRSHFTVDIVNGSPGHELKVDNRRIVGTYLRVGLTDGHGWRTFKVRQDFAAAAKVQTQDDISASIVVPADRVLNATVLPEGVMGDASFGGAGDPSRKFVVNCEYRLFQRPDDAIHRGLDKQAESDLARRDVNFVSNFEPLTRADVLLMMEQVVDFDAFTAPMKELLQSVQKGESGYIVCSDNPRRIGGVPSKNPRYLQDRPDMADPLPRYVAEMGARLFRKIPASQPLHLPVDGILSGRRNNPPEPEKKIRSLAVYAPLHYQELPELFMDYVCSLTGKSPSTTGAGSEGALTKGPFNALRTTADLNAALVGMLLTQLGGFSTAAGYIGPRGCFEHDISLLIPEIWCRLSPEEREPRSLIARGHLKAVPDIEYQGQTIAARRLGYRITQRFVREFFGRVFDNPDKVFDRLILEPETQDLDSYADGVLHILEAQQRVARQYFEDGSIEEACPPLKILLTIMAEGSYQGKDERDPAIRAQFTREALLASDWYQARLQAKQRREIALWSRHVAYLREQGGTPSQQTRAAAELAAVSRPEFVQELIGTIGLQPTYAPAL